jgi:hypothetical protein
VCLTDKLELNSTRIGADPTDFENNQLLPELRDSPKP